MHFCEMLIGYSTFEKLGTAFVSGVSGNDVPFERVNFRQILVIIPFNDIRNFNKDNTDVLDINKSPSLSYRDSFLPNIENESHPFK